MENQEHYKIKKIDELIGQLPQNFPGAAVVIKKDIVPLLVDCDKGIIDHYCTLVKKHTRAASKSAVTKLVNETIRELQTAGYRNDIHVEETSEADSNTPEIIETAKRIAQDPQLLKNKIDTVNELGVTGERKNIGLNLITIDSRLLPISGGKPENLGLKNSGHQGSGKSNQLTKSLKIYPETAYHIFSSVTPKGLMMMSDMLKHKAVVFSEAKTFEAAKRDTHQAYIVRSLLSEGFFEEPRQTLMDQGWATETLRIQGPISLLTTTIKGKLEQQLEDRILTAHSDTSSDQTRRVLKQTAAAASGIENSVDDSLVKAWQQFHDMLEPAEVVIPYATELIQYLPNHPLPVSARRAFVRVLSAIKTITILYQAQRNRDERGRLIAEYADYAMAYQLIGDCFANSVNYSAQLN